MKKFVCVHGHFYQPPRENPWTNEVDAEETAKPFHDWNERITKECYEPNTRAAILDAKGQPTQHVNNFLKMSFDIGPTLLSWLRRHNLTVYQAILDADRRSVSENHGHGNAMAQVYNHLIMPLAKRRDKITQIRWGIRDFQFHFKRKPEGMWLSETAVDRESLNLMAEHGINFTVLAPHQAHRVRHLGFGARWHDVRNENIECRHPYRILLDKGRMFHIFFYSAPLSREIAFHGLLNSGDEFTRKILHSYSKREREHLVSMATDGESFGHHHKFGEMALAYAIKKIEDHKAAKVTNFADYLDQHGTFWEVDIHENSSWSCCHGVGRWRSDCGCRIHAQAGWNQKWRANLREAFDFLSEVADEIFENELSALVKDPWEARNEYIDVLLNPDDATRDRFLEQQAKKKLSAEETQKVWSLLEAQKFALFMYTSCGWFFDDISGIEPIKVMQFAARAMELIQPYYPKTIEPFFLKILEQASSNHADLGTGADIFNRFVKPTKPVTEAKV